MTEGTGLVEFERRFPDRFFDAEIAEQHAVSFAAGLAIRGMRPCVAIYSTFLQRAYDEILTEVCLQNLPVVFAIDRAGIVGRDGETHHGVFDLSYLLPIPNMTVFAPKDGEELRELLAKAFAIGGPVAIRYPRGAAEGVSYTEEEGGDALLFSCGAMLSHALEAKELLKERGIVLNVRHISRIKPLDAEAVRRAAAGKKRVFTLEDNVTFGGFGDSVASVLAADGITVRKLGWPDAFIPHGSQSELFERYGLDGRSLAEEIATKR
jgi:1-deoxy-D-xylulose-5-phosphate synthase